MALPLAGFAVWGGSQLASGVGAPTFGCNNAGAVVQFSQGSGFAAGTNPGLFVDTGAGGAKVHSAGVYPAESSTIAIDTPEGLVPGQPVTLPGDQEVYVTSIETNAYYPSVPSTEAVLTLSAPTIKALALGTSITVDATDGTHGTEVYNADENAPTIQLFSSGCSSTEDDFYPLSVSSPPVTLPSGSNDATSLEAKSAAVTFPLTWPSDPSEAYATGSASDTISFAAGKGVFDATDGVYTYTDGHVTGTYATNTATATLGLDGAIICTQDELSDVVNDHANPLVVCDGGSGTDVPQIDVLIDLLSLQEYYGTNGQCVSYPTPCTPYGSDGSLLSEIVQLDLGGSADL